MQEANDAIIRFEGWLASVIDAVQVKESFGITNKDIENTACKFVPTFSAPIWAALIAMIIDILTQNRPYLA